MDIPSNLKFTAEHEWVDLLDGHAVVGITAYAADALGDVVYVDLPTVGSVVAAGKVCGEIESTKSVSDLYAPLDGEVIETNTALNDDPSLVNADPFHRGWLFKLKVHAAVGLMSSEAYGDLIKDA